MSKVIYGAGGFRPAHPTQGKIEEHVDGTSTVTRWNDAGAVIETRPYTPAETAQAVAGAAETARRTNRTTIEQRAGAVLSANATYLAVVSPSVGAVTAQVRRNTMAINGLIKLALSLLDNTDGT